MKRIKVFGSGADEPSATQEGIDKWLEGAPYKPEIIQLAVGTRGGGMFGFTPVLFILYELRSAE